MSKIGILIILLRGELYSPSISKQMVERLKNISLIPFISRFSFGFAFMFLLPTVAFTQSLLANVNFSDSIKQLSSFYIEAGEPYSFDISDSVERDGTPSGKFELRYGDKEEGGSTRSEISYNNISTRETWVGFSLYLPARSWAPDSKPQITCQIHTWDTLGGILDISPPVSFVRQNGNLMIEINYSKADTASYSNIIRIIDTIGATITNEWTDYVLHVKYGIKDGFVQIWQNKILVVNYLGSVGYKNCRPPVVKFGIYKWPWAEGASDVSTRIAYYDDIKIADSTGNYNLVAYRPLKINKPPVAKVKNNKIEITLPTDSIVLDGTGSSDSDGNVVSYQWMQQSGPSTSNIANKTSARTEVTDLQAGVYVFQLIVKDNDGITSTSEVKVTVNPSPNKTTIAQVKPDHLPSILPNGLPGKTVIGWGSSGKASPTLFTNLFDRNSRDSNKNQTDASQLAILGPNPTSNIARLRLSNHQIGKMLVTVYDVNGNIQGKECFDKDQEYFSHSIDISNLPNAIYFIHIEINGHTTTLKLAKIE